MISIERVETPQYEFHWWSYDYIVEAWPWIKCRKRHGTSSSADYVDISLPDLCPDIPRTRRQVTPLFLIYSYVPPPKQNTLVFTIYYSFFSSVDVIEANFLFTP
jgi:hypothetical protein